MRVLRFFSACICLAMAASGFARAQGSDVAPKEQTQVATQDPTVVDPFAKVQAPESSTHPPIPPPASNAPESTTATAQTDPFAEAQTADASSRNPSQFTRSLKLLYQGTYLPDLLSGEGGDQAQQDFFLDAGFNWASNEDASLGVRIVANHEQSKNGSMASHSDDVTALEYFYRQQFADATQALTIGRKTMDWSSGFQWRPADLIDNGFSTKNVNIESPYRYRGVDQLRYELIQPSFEAVAILSNRDKDFFGGDQVAVKLTLKSIADVSMIASVNGNYSRKYGVIIDSNLPWATTLALEAVHVDVDKDKLTDPAHFGRTLESLSGISSYEDVYLRLTKFIDDKRRMSLEYFHNGRGFDGAQIAVAADRLPLAVDPALFSQQYLGRDYVYMAYTGYVDTWRLQFKPSVLVNISDGSYSGAISVERELSGSSNLTLYVDTFHGGAGSEFGSVTHGLGVGISYVFHFF
ncbi:MAG: hypothetical protein LBQ20_06560 [Rhodanobacter sp.]|jgi:hypothetical protein|nr:hypothetical protein [Rhodanobacter sp.]